MGVKSTNSTVHMGTGQSSVSLSIPETTDKKPFVLQMNSWESKFSSAARRKISVSSMLQEGGDLVYGMEAKVRQVINDKDPSPHSREDLVDIARQVETGVIEGSDRINADLDAPNGIAQPTKLDHISSDVVQRLCERPLAYVFRVIQRARKGIESNASQTEGAIGYMNRVFNKIQKLTAPRS